MPREEGPKAFSKVSNVTESCFALACDGVVWVGRIADLCGGLLDSHSQALESQSRCP